MASDNSLGERLVACRNPELAEHRAAKREALLAATEGSLAKIERAVAEGRLTACGAIARRALRQRPSQDRYASQRSYPLFSLRGLLDRLQGLHRTVLKVVHGKAEGPFLYQPTEPDPVQQEALRWAGVKR